MCRHSALKLLLIGRGLLTAQPQILLLYFMNIYTNDDRSRTFYMRIVTNCCCSVSECVYAREILSLLWALLHEERVYIMYKRNCFAFSPILLNRSRFPHYIATHDEYRELKNTIFRCITASVIHFKIIDTRQRCDDYIHANFLNYQIAERVLPVSLMHMFDVCHIWPWYIIVTYFYSREKIWGENFSFIQKTKKLFITLEFNCQLKQHSFKAQNMKIIYKCGTW